MFEDQKNLYSLSSGYHAPEDVKKDLMNIEVTRAKLQEGFVNDRIKAKKVSFCYPIKKNKLKIFSTNTSKISIRKALAERDMFNRLAAREFAEKDINLKELSSFSLPPDTLSLSSSDRPIYTGCKANFLQRLEESIPLSDMHATNSCFCEYIWWHT